MMWADLLTGFLLALGGFFVFVGGVGVVRMPDLYTRMHAASVTETLGTLLILVGLMVHSGLNLATFKVFLILVFLLFTAPVASYAVANTALIAGLKPKLEGDDTVPEEQPAGASK
jgi:multicomponent Na+:H+ antiporter subunit G